MAPKLKLVIVLEKGVSKICVLEKGIILKILRKKILEGVYFSKNCHTLQLLSLKRVFNLGQAQGGGTQVKVGMGMLRC